MNLAEVSKNKFWTSFEYWDVDAEMAEPIFNYLVYGFSPGSFYTAVLANDFTLAIGCSHPANTIPELKNLVKWMINCMPSQAWGSNYNVKEWLNMSPELRREILEKNDLIFTEKEETWEILNES